MPKPHQILTTPPGFYGQHDDAFVIRFIGVLNAAACEDLQDALIDAEASGARRILLDLEQLVSLDAAALHLILKASRRNNANGNRLEVTRGRGHVADLFRLTALDQSLSFALGPG